jgi:hypothetical protein
MGRNAKLILGLAIFIIAGLSIGTYAYFQSREFLRGPQVTIDSPAPGSTLTESAVLLVGSAQNIATITLNGSPIFVDSQGHFSQKLLLFEGYNILTVRAEDRFGKRVEKTLELIYKGPVKEIRATSTPPFTL